MTGRFWRRTVTISAIAIAIAVGWIGSHVVAGQVEKPRIDLAEIGKTTTYAPQKVVYHLLEKGGSSDRKYFDGLGSARNHLRAVGDDRIDMRFVLQGDGIELLQDATRNPDLAATIDQLRAKGVRFLVCRNTLIGRELDPFTALHGVKAEDIVPAGVAEVTALQMQGFAYLRL